jgi:hypothetical protein
VFALVIVIFAAKRIFLLDYRSGSSVGSFPASGKSVFLVPQIGPAGGVPATTRSERRWISPPRAPGRAPGRLDRALGTRRGPLERASSASIVSRSRSADDELDAKKLCFIEQLVTIRHRSRDPSAIGPILRRPPRWASWWGVEAGAGPSMEQRWASLLTSSFVVIDLDPRFETDADDTRRPGRPAASRSPRSCSGRGGCA